MNLPSLNYKKASSLLVRLVFPYCNFETQLSLRVTSKKALNTFKSIPHKNIIVRHLASNELSSDLPFPEELTFAKTNNILLHFQMKRQFELHALVFWSILVQQTGSMPSKTEFSEYMKGCVGETLLSSINIPHQLNIFSLLYLQELIKLNLDSLHPSELDIITKWLPFSCTNLKIQQLNSNAKFLLVLSPENNLSSTNPPKGINSLNLSKLNLSKPLTLGNNWVDLEELTIGSIEDEGCIIGQLSKLRYLNFTDFGGRITLSASLPSLQHINIRNLNEDTGFPMKSRECLLPDNITLTAKNFSFVFTKENPYRGEEPDLVKIDASAYDFQHFIFNEVKGTGTIVFSQSITTITTDMKGSLTFDENDIIFTSSDEKLTMSFPHGYPNLQNITTGDEFVNFDL